MYKKLKIYLFLILAFIILLFFLILIQFEKKVMPVALSVSEKYAALVINKEINSVTNEVINELKICKDSFFIKETDENNRVNYLEINSILINNLTSQIAKKLSENLYNMRKEKIKIPVGVLSGYSLLSDFGPDLYVRIYPLGLSTIDYESSFSSVGINQVNFQLWLNIECRVNVINPLYKKEYVMKRKLILVNTVYSGEVPETYLPFNDN